MGQMLLAKNQEKEERIAELEEQVNELLPSAMHSDVCLSCWWLRRKLIVCGSL